MGMIEQEYKELRQLMKDYRDGKVDRNYVNTQIGIFSQMEKRQKNLISIQSLAVKANNQKPVNALKKANVIGDGTAIDLTLEESESETIRCPNTGSLITREFCLNYSGSHDTKCQNCSHRKKTVEKLIDNQ